MNSARDLLRSYMEILSEAPAAPAPTPKAGLAQAPADGAMRPGAAPAAAPAAQQEPAEEPRSYGPGAATGSWGTTIDGPGGSTTKVDPSTGQKTVSGETGADITDASGTPIAHRDPSLGGMSTTTYTGSAGKGPASGAQDKSFYSGDINVDQSLNAAGKQTSATSTYVMGPETKTITQQGDQNAPTQTTTSQTPISKSIQEEDEHPESARHLLKKLLKLLKDEEQVEENKKQLPSPPDEVHLPKHGSKHGPVDVYKPKKSAENEKDDSEEKVAESLMHLYKAIKEGRIQ